MHIVTAGSKYMDIDAYGGCIAYADLLRKQGLAARAVSTAPLNASVTPAVRAWGGELDHIYTPATDDTFSLVDVSQPESFEPFIDLDRVEMVIDHHPGNDTFWHQRIGDRARIEAVGAACTQVYERWVQAGLLDQLGATNARLLMAGILDNTLDFRAKITTERDRRAYEALAKIADLPANFPAQYFSDCQQAIEQDLAQAIRDDLKHINSSYVTYPGLPDTLGQLVIWDASQLLAQRLTEIEAVMKAEAGGDDWLMNVVSIVEGVSVLIVSDLALQTGLQKLLQLDDFERNRARAQRLWLRKEMLQASLDAAKTTTET